MKPIQKLILLFAGVILLAANASATRWLTRDPMDIPQHMERDPLPTLDINAYTFVRNSPLNYVDPFGKNAYLITGGAIPGVTGHTVIAIDDGNGGLMVYNYYALAHSQGDSLGDIQAFFAAGPEYIWSHDWQSQSEFFNDFANVYGNASVISLAIGTPQDDANAIDYLNWLQSNNGESYSYLGGASGLGGENCHTWSAHQFENYVGAGTKASPENIISAQPVQFGPTIVNPPQNVWFTPNALMPVSPFQSFQPNFQVQ